MIALYRIDFIITKSHDKYHMEKLKFKIYLSLILLLYSTFTFCQSNDSTYLKYLLKNKDVSKRYDRTCLSKNILKTNIVQLLDGEFQTTWEHRFNNNFGFDLGPGLILPYSCNSYFGRDTNIKVDRSWMFNAMSIFLYNNEQFVNEQFGFSLLVEPKYYFFSKTKLITTDHSNSIGPFYRFRSYSNLTINEFGIAYTYLPGFSKLTYTPSVAFSYTIQTPFNNVSDLKFFGNPTSKINSLNLPNYHSFRIYIRVDIGYVFN